MISLRLTISLFDEQLIRNKNNINKTDIDSQIDEKKIAEEIKNAISSDIIVNDTTKNNSSELKADLLSDETIEKIKIEKSEKIEEYNY